MAPYQPTPSRLLPTLLIVLATLVVGAIGTVIGLAALGIVDLAIWKRPVESHEGMVAVPVSVGVVPAYRVVTREHLIEVSTGDFKVVYLYPESVRSAGILADVSKIIGRVTAREKPAGYAFKEEDFMPPGTPPGLAGATPPGMVGIPVEADKIKGIHPLKQGDHFDLVASLPIDTKMTAAGRTRPLLGYLPNAEKHALVKVLVHDGIVLSPVYTRQAPVAGVTRKGSPEQTQTSQYVELAVGAEEAGALAEALTIKAEISCIARSGRKSDAKAVGVDVSPAQPRAYGVELIVGKNRDFVQFPVPPASNNGTARVAGGTPDPASAP
jgi:hypothetical protein